MRVCRDTASLNILGQRVWSWRQATSFLWEAQGKRGTGCLPRVVAGRSLQSHQAPVEWSWEVAGTEQFAGAI